MCHGVIGWLPPILLSVPFHSRFSYFLQFYLLWTSFSFLLIAFPPLEFDVCTLDLPQIHPRLHFQSNLVFLSEATTCLLIAVALLLPFSVTATHLLCFLTSITLHSLYYKSPTFSNFFQSFSFQILTSFRAGSHFRDYSVLSFIYLTPSVT